jgi:hypothetical protein
MNKRMELITKAWETSQNMDSLGSRAHKLLLLLQTDLKNEESFYVHTVIPFAFHVNNMVETRRRQHDLPSNKQLTQLEAYWKEKVKNMYVIVKSYEQAISRKETLLTKLTKIDLAVNRNDFQDPSLILNLLASTKQDFDKQVDNLNALSLETFYSIIEYHEQEVHNWLLRYSTFKSAMTSTSPL